MQELTLFVMGPNSRNPAATETSARRLGLGNLEHRSGFGSDISRTFDPARRSACCGKHGLEN